MYFAIERNGKNENNRRLWQTFQKKDYRYKTVTYRRLHVVIRHLIDVHKKNWIIWKRANVTRNENKNTTGVDGTSKMSADKHSHTSTSRLPADKEIKAQTTTNSKILKLCFY